MSSWFTREEDVNAGYVSIVVIEITVYSLVRDFREFMAPVKIQSEPLARDSCLLYELKLN